MFRILDAQFTYLSQKLIFSLYITYKVLLYVPANGFQFSVLSKSPPEFALLNLLRVFRSSEASVKIDKWAEMCNTKCFTFFSSD
jgi:hypothetical protein